MGGSRSFRGFDVLNFVGEGPESDEEPVADLWSDEESDDDDDEEDEDDDDDNNGESEDEVVDFERFLFLSTTRELSRVNV